VIRKLVIGIATLMVAATPSYATTITYNFAARIDLATVFINDLTLDSVQSGDVLHGTITLDASLPDLDASADIGSYVAMSVPSVLSLTVGPFGMFPQETFPTSSFLVRIAENGHGFDGNEELLILSNGSFLANGDQVDQFEVRLDSDSLSFLSGTGFPVAVNLGLLNSNSVFEFIGHDPTRPSDSGFEFFGSFTEFEVASDAVPEPGSIVLIGSGLITLAGSRRRRQRSNPRPVLGASKPARHHRHSER
jgi:hypothetical protein